MQSSTNVTSDIGLLRLLGTGSATALVISNMIGATIFGTPGLMLGALGSPSLIIVAWGIGGALALAGALSYAELGINFPSAGGEFVYLTHAYGKAWGFTSGWVSFFAGFSAPIAASALIFAHYVTKVFPQIEKFSVTVGPAAFALRFGTEQIFAAVLITVCSLVNCFGIVRASRLQNLLTLSKVLLIVALVGGGFLIGAGKWDHIFQKVARTSVRPLPIEFFIQLLWVMVAYSGWNAATYIAEELREPERTLPRALAL